MTEDVEKKKPTNMVWVHFRIERDLFNHFTMTARIRNETAKDIFNAAAREYVEKHRESMLAILSKSISKE